jgi:hypothetical protein
MAGGEGAQRDLRYEVDEKPPHALALALGAQSIALIIAGIVLTPMIVLAAGVMPGGPWAIFAAVMVSGPRPSAVEPIGVGAAMSCHGHVGRLHLRLHHRDRRRRHCHDVHPDRRLGTDPVSAGGQSGIAVKIITPHRRHRQHADRGHRDADRLQSGIESA